jgi:excisionase family DNA binding protein
VQKTLPTPLAVSPRDAAYRAGVSRSRIYELLKSGELVAFKDGARTLILVASIEAWLERLKPFPRSTPPIGPLLPRADRKLARRRSRNPDAGPTGPLLPVEQQQIAIERAPPPIDQQQPTVEPEPAPDIGAVYAECLRLLAPNGEEEGRLRAFERAVRAVSRDRTCSQDEAKQLAAIAKAKERA